MSSKKILVDFFYDVVSPYAWLGFEQITRHQNVWPTVQVRLRPVLISFLMKGSGNKPPMVVANKAMYMVKDTARLNKYLNVPLTVPDDFMEVAMVKGTLKPMRFITAVDSITETKGTEDITREFYKRIFTKHLDVIEPESLRQAGKDAGLDSAVIESALVQMNEQPIKDILTKNVSDALEHGAFGTPTIVAHLESGPEMFFGSDRIELLAHTLGVKYHGPLTNLSKL
jgi:glutathione S-transferase kappa 1